MSQEQLDAKTAGGAAFDVYCQNVKGLALNSFPPWHVLPRSVQLAWEAAAYAAGQWYAAEAYDAGQRYAPQKPLYIVVSCAQNGERGVMAVKATMAEAEAVQTRWIETLETIDIERWSIGEEMEVEP